MSKTKAKIASDKAYKKGLVAAIIEINNILNKKGKINIKLNYDDLMKKKIPYLENLYDEYIRINLNLKKILIGNNL